MKKNKSLKVVYLPPPCANGDLHFGHIAGVYLPADIFSRVIEKLYPSSRVITIAGSDENNTYALKKSFLNNVPLTESLDFYTNRIHKSLSFLSIKMDQFIRTSSETHSNMSNSILENLKKSNKVTMNDSYQLYSEKEDSFISDSLAIGECYKCGKETDAGTCENCGELIQHIKLINPKHYQSKEKLVLRPSQSYSINFKNQNDKLERIINKQNWPKRIKSLAIQWLRSNQFSSLEITKIFKFGLKIKNSSVSDLSIPLWFEAVWAYYTGIFESLRLNSINSFFNTIRKVKIDLYFFMGQDNRFHFTISDILVRNLLRLKKIRSTVNIQPFFTISNEKFSTSRDRAIFIGEVETYFNSSFLRFSLYHFYCSNKTDFNLNVYFEAIKELKNIKDFISNFKVLENSKKFDSKDFSKLTYIKMLRKDIKLNNNKSLIKILNKIQKQILRTKI
ncbi:class I tRNA ligase family protein, partial [Leptospira perdikensis]